MRTKPSKDNITETQWDYTCFVGSNADVHSESKSLRYVCAVPERYWDMAPGCSLWADMSMRADIADKA